VKPIGEGRNHTVEPVGMSRSAVQEAEGRLARNPPLEEMQREATDANDAALGALAPEQCGFHHAILANSRWWMDFSWSA
jgi:hypothetical protein